MKQYKVEITMKKVPRYPGNLLPSGIGITFDRYID